MDDNGPEREGDEKFARKLGLERCLVVLLSGRRGWNGGGKGDLPSKEGAGPGEKGDGADQVAGESRDAVDNNNTIMRDGRQRSCGRAHNEVSHIYCTGAHIAQYIMTRYCTGAHNCLLP